MEFEDVTVAVLTQVCISMFENCLSHDKTMQSQWAENRLADFKLWSDGVGALAAGPASLDSRLNSRPADLALVTGSLVMLKDFLIHCDNLAEAGDSIEESIDGVNTMLRNLALLAIAIRRTGRRNRVEKADKKFRPEDHAGLESLLKILCHRQKSAKEKTTANGKDVKISTGERLHEIESTRLSNSQERLIKANLLRRNRFLQAQRHSEGLKASHKRGHLTAGSREGQQHRIEKNTARVPEGQVVNAVPDMPSAPTELTASKTIASVPEGTLDLKGTQRESSKAAVTIITTLTTAMQYPKPPKLRDSADIFKCPCCCQSLHRDIATEKTQWKKHLSQDISPYTCLLEDCPKPLVTYANQQGWEDHVKSDHPPRRLCPFCRDSSRVFLGMEEFADHIQAQHSENISEGLMMAIMNHTGVVTVGVTACPLCPSTGPESDPSFIKHVLQCIHDFSMRSLPWASDRKEKLKCNGSFNLNSMKYEAMLHWLSGLGVEWPVGDQYRSLGHDECTSEDTEHSYFNENDYFNLHSDQDSLEAFERSSASFYGSGISSFLDGADMSDSMESEEENLPFPIPSYLRNTTYISNLKVNYEAKSIFWFSDSEKVDDQAHWIDPDDQAYGIDPNYLPPPSRWENEFRGGSQDVPIIRETEFIYVGPISKHDHEGYSVRANRPIPIHCEVYYFEIKIEDKHRKGMIGIGFSSEKASLERLLGWEAESWAYHSDDGKTFFAESQGQGTSYGPTFGVGDTVGCGVHFSTGRAFFTKNGENLGTAFEDDRFLSLTLFPSIGIKRIPNFRAIANFGHEPFVFDIDNYVQSIVMAESPKPGVVSGLDARDVNEEPTYRSESTPGILSDKETDEVPGTVLLPSAQRNEPLGFRHQPRRLSISSLPSPSTNPPSSSSSQTAAPQKKKTADGQIVLDQYEIGWICNQSDSFEAAKEMLDTLSSPLEINQDDHNSYAFGNIGERKVVIGLVNEETPNEIPNSLPSFAHIENLLFVGTGGWTPNLSEQIDVRLGDVVTNLTEYEVKRFYLENGEIKSHGSFSPAPSPLRAPISNMKSENKSGIFLATILSGMGKLLSEAEFASNNYKRTLVSRPHVADRLYRRDYPHVGSLALLANNTSAFDSIMNRRLRTNPCLNCDESEQVSRPEREDADPLIHAGTIAVIDREMGDLGPILRDSLAEHGVSSLMSMKGFNYESSPLMICGVSDYADSHKNKIWRPYAATVAALVARGIILAMPSEE